MAMTVRLKAELAAAVLALGLGVVGVRSWRSERNARAAAEQTAAADQKQIDQASHEITALKSADAARDKQTAVQLADLETAAQAAKTPVQITKYLTASFARSGAPVPVTIMIPAATLANPNPAAIASLPEIDLPFLRDQAEKCQADALEVTTDAADLASCRAQMKLAGEQLSAAENQSDAWKKAANGGTFLTRLKRGAKWFAIGAGAGAVALCGTGHCK
jgi:hypothetical protein